MRIAICEDDQQELQQLVQALRGWDPLLKPESYMNGASFLEAARKAPSIDLAFLDIYLPGENGTDIAQALRGICPNVAIVFVTTSQLHGVEAFQVDALHYLVKPVDTAGVMEVFRRMGLANLREQQRPRLTLNVGREIHTVFQEDIACLQSVNHAVEVTMVDQQMLRVWTTLGQIEQKLAPGFLKVNRGTIVNMEQIEQMGRDTCVLRSGIRIVLTLRDRTAIRETYNNFLFAKMANGEKVTGRLTNETLADIF